MRHSHQPVSLGSPRSNALDTGGFRVTELWFAPGTVIEPHTHDRDILAVMLDGSFETDIAGRRLECSAHTMWTEPCAERHANRVGSGGAHVVVAQPHPAWRDETASFARVLGEVSCARDPVIARDARRVSAELASPDTLSPLALESLLALVLTRAARLTEPRRVLRRPPAWLLRARDALHDSFRTPPRLARVAADVGVTQWHLAREFRRQFHSSIGEYVRAIRVNRALELLGAGETSISEVAMEAGFADQSHLTRECRRATGLSPAAYRRAARSVAAGER